MSRIAIPDTAFARTVSKRPRIERPDHLAWIRTLPCLITGMRPVDAAHIRYPELGLGKLPTGLGEKPSDMWTVPLHRAVHTDQHACGERAWWHDRGIDPLPIALALWACSGDDDIANVILREARP